MISIYTSAFNLVKNAFNYQDSISRFCDFAEEVVVAVNTSEDDTLNELQKLGDVYKNLLVVPCDISYQDPWLDGKIKNYALQHTKYPIKISLDMDEYIPSFQKNIWINLCANLLADSVMCYMIPSVNLYKDFDHYYSVSPKWYMHKAGLFRGPVSYARNSDGTVDTNKSDTCELIDKYGNLVLSKTYPCDINMLQTKKFPYVIHTGYIDLEARLIRNKNFWSQHWLIESGGKPPPHKIHSTIDDFDEIPKKHGLDL